MPVGGRARQSPGAPRGGAAISTPEGSQRPRACLLVHVETHQAPDSLDELRGSDRDKPKAWKTIWGCGQGIGAVHDVPGAAELVERLGREYEAAWEEMAALRDAWRPAAKRRAA